MKFTQLKNKFLVLAVIITSLNYLIWRIFFTIPFEFGTASLIAGLSLLIVEVFGMIESGVHYRNLISVEHPVKPNVEDEKLYPDVDVFIATYNEPSDIIYKTVNGCVNMDYPDKSKVHIYICDDSNRREIQVIAEEMKVNYITRTERKHAKAGNLNNALSKTSSPLIVTFDADMVPMHDFLMTCTPFFIGSMEEIEGKKNADDIKNNKKFKYNGKVGFVQTPQSFYNLDLFQYNLFSEDRIPNEQDYFYRDIQVSRNRTNSVIYGGSNTMISREALNEVGGFYTEVITEDFATGMLIESKGYRCYAIDEIHASGLSPQDLKSLIKQRERWGRGCIQTGRKLNIIFRKGLNWRQKISYLAAISYWYSGLKRFVYIISPILYSVFNIIVVKCTALQIILFWLPMYVVNNIALTKLSKNIRNVRWNNIYETILFPSLLPVIFLETLGISQNKFVVTRKGQSVNDTYYQTKKAVPHIILALLCLIGIIRTIKIVFDVGSLLYAMFLFWLSINFYTLIMCIFFMIGRDVHRSQDRFSISTECSIYIKKDKEIKCVTYDISEGGAGVLLKFPEYIPYDKDILLQLRYEGYVCRFKARVSNIYPRNHEWHYGFILSEIEDLERRKLLSIIYDREPQLPRYIKSESGAFDDIRINVLNRRNKKDVFSRKLPRIALNKQFNSKECGKVKILDFNYEYALVELDHCISDFDKLSIQIVEDIQMNLALGKDKENEKILVEQKKQHWKQKYGNKEYENKNLHLYVVENYKELADNIDFMNLLDVWIKEYRNKKELERKNNNSLKSRLKSDDEFDELSNI